MSVPATAFAQGSRPRRGGSAAPPPPSGPTIDIASLVVSNRQPTDWAWHRGPTGPGGCAGGAATFDSVTGLHSLRLTSPSYPVTNTRAYIDYASVGPLMSQPDENGGVWVVFNAVVPGEGNIYHVAKLSRGAPPTMATPVALPRNPTRDTLVGFSRNPLTPWLLFVAREGSPPRVHAIDCRTNTEVFSVLGATWPLLMPELAGFSLFWLSTSADHSRLSCFSGTSNETVVVYNTQTGAVVRQTTAATFEDGLGGVLFNEGSISPSGRYYSGRFGSSLYSRIWDLETGHLSANFVGVPFGAQAAHLSWGSFDGEDVVIADDPYDLEIGRQGYMVVQPITSPGASPGTWTRASSTVGQRVQTNHTSSFFSRTGVAVDQQYTTGGAFVRFDMQPVPGTWTALGGGVYQTTATISSGLRLAVGIVDAWECETITASRYTTALRTLTKRSPGTSALNANEWSADAISGTSQVVRVRMQDSGDPTNRIQLGTSPVNNQAVAMVRLDNGDARLISRAHTLEVDASGVLDYFAISLPQIGHSGAGWCLHNTNHGTPGGRVDVIAVQLPVTST